MQVNGRPANFRSVMAITYAAVLLALRYQSVRRLLHRIIAALVGVLAHRRIGSDAGAPVPFKPDHPTVRAG